MGSTAIKLVCDRCNKEPGYMWLQVAEWECIPTADGGTFVRKMRLYCSYACLLTREGADDER